MVYKAIPQCGTAIIQLLRNHVCAAHPRELLLEENLFETHHIFQQKPTILTDSSSTIRCASLSLLKIGFSVIYLYGYTPRKDLG